MTITDHDRTQPATPALDGGAAAPLGGEPGDLEEEICSIIAAQLALRRAFITAATNFEDIGADIYDIAELIVSLEEAFGIDVPDEGVDALVTVGDLIIHVRHGMLARPR